ncbi:hypothetical protein MY3957_003354 [Beauveria namnaoensis]
MLKHILLVSTILGATLATPVAEPESATDLEKRCTPPGQFCNRGVPCCSGAWCGNNGLCSSCIPPGQFCNRGVPCCSGAWCGNNGLCSRCIPRGQFCNRGVPCCAGSWCGTNGLCS